MVSYMSKKQILRKECLVNILQRLNGKSVLMTESGEIEEEKGVIKDLECFTYICDKNNKPYIALLDFGSSEESTNNLRIKMETIKEVELIDIDEEDDGTISNIYLVTRFNSGNELHIVNAA